MSPLELLHNWYERVWVEQDLDAIHALFSPDTEAMGLIDFGVGPEDIYVMAMATLAQTEVSEITFDREIEMGPWAWAAFTFKASLKATGEPIKFTGQIMARIEDGQIVEAYNQVDFITLLEQMHYLPPDSLALCMSGEGLGL